MIEITSAQIIPANEELKVPESMTVFFKVNGQDWSVGNLPVTMTKAQIQSYLEEHESDYLADITHSQPQIVERKVLNPIKEGFKTSILYNITPTQLDTYIDSNVANLAQAREFLKKMGRAILWLAKQSKLE